MQHKQIVALFIFLFSFAFVAHSQKLVNSPYSRFNIGSIEPAASFKSLGMGGVEVAMKSNNSVLFSNPASYSSIDTNSFLFDIGIDYSINYLADSISKFHSDDMNFDHLIMGFPLAKGLGLAIGVVPFSSGYYKMSESVLQDDPKYDPSIGVYNSNHNGEGGFNKLFIGSGININKNFSVGINMTLLFGEVKRLYQINFADISGTYSNYATERLKINGVNFDYGLQYTRPLRNDYFLNAGLSFSTNKSYKTKFDQLAYRNNSFNKRDTISYISDDSTKTYIPGTLRLGISIGKRNKFIAGFDFISTKWGKSQIPGLKGYAADTRTYRFGAEYIPEKYSNYSFIKRIEYRIGAHYGDNYLIINGDQIKEYGASMGIGVPMRRSLSRTNFFFDFTRKNGSPTSHLHSENFYTLGVSLNLYDFWFIKRKYD